MHHVLLRDDKITQFIFIITKQLLAALAEVFRPIKMIFLGTVGGSKEQPVGPKSRSYEQEFSL